MPSMRRHPGTFILPRCRWSATLAGMNEGLYTLLGAAIAGLVALVGIWTREQALDRHRFTERKQVLYTD